MINNLSINKIVNDIGKAKEKRFALKKKLIETKSHLVSININIAGFPKSDNLIKNFFLLVLDGFKRHLKSHQLYFDHKFETIVSDAAGDYFVCPVKTEISAIALKEICEKFEVNHPCGRLIDVDVFSKGGEYISSGKEKKCLLCSNTANICRRAKTHSIDEVRTYTIKTIEDYIENEKKHRLCKQISYYASKALFSEISLFPKPGLVTPISQGSHTDMNYAMFVDSSLILSSNFYNLAVKAHDFKETKNEILPIVRDWGLQVEDEMFAVTNKVNTQKGAIFLMGLSVFTSVLVLKQSEKFSPEKFRKLLIEISAPLLEEINLLPSSTHGAKCIKKYGFEIAGGARKEAIEGFPNVFNKAIPYLKENYTQLRAMNKQRETVLLKALCIIIADNNDTNILYRGNPDLLSQFKQIASTGLDRNISPKDIIIELNTFCNKHHLSPGGSADLLALALFFIEIVKQY